MESYRFLLDLALILLTTKIFGLITRRLQLPQVVGALLAGLVFGPGVLGILQPSDFLSSLSEIGVIVIMFSAGMTTDIRELKNAGEVRVFGGPHRGAGAFGHGHGAGVPVRAGGERPRGGCCSTYSSAPF